MTREARRFSAVCLSLAVIGLVSLVVPVFAVPTSYHTVWFSDESRTNVVGERIRECDGTIEQWGERTAFYIHTYARCAAGGGCSGGVPCYIDGVYFPCCVQEPGPFPRV